MKRDRGPSLPRAGVALLCVVVLLVSAGALPALVAAQEGTVVGRPELSVFAPDNRIVGGGQVTLDVQVTNEGTLTRGGPSRFEEEVKTARNVRLSVQEDELAPELADNVEVLSGTIPVGSVPEGVSGPFPLRLEVDEAIEPGTYQIPVRLEYEYTSVVQYSGVDEPEYSTFSRTQDAELTIVVREQARFELDADSRAVAAAETAVKQFTVTNVGSQVATDAELRLSAANGSLFFGPNDAPKPTAQVSLDSLDPGASRTVAVRVGAPADLPPGGYPLSAVVTYRTPAGVQARSSPLSVTVPVGAEQTFNVGNVTDTLRVGERGVVEGLLVNTGDRRVENAVVLFPDDVSGLQPREPEFAVGTLEPGEAVPFRFVVDAANGSVSGPRVLDLAVRYRDRGGDVQTRDAGDATVNVAGEQTFELHDVASDFRVGGSGTLQGTVVNTGELAVTDAVVVLADVGEAFEPRERRVPVGDLAPGESADFQFPAAIPATAEAGPQFLAVQIRYRGQGDEVRTSDILDARIEVGPEQSFALDDVESTLQVGDTGTVSGTLINAGDRPVEQATLLVRANGSDVRPRETAYALGTLEPGEPVPFSFTADVPAGVAPGPRVLQLQVRYRDDETRLSDVLDARVGVAPEQSFALRNVSGTLRVGERGQLTATLVNTGDVTASDVSLQAIGNGSLSPLSPAAAAGTLEPGESAPVAFTFDVPRTADPGERPFSFRVRYQGRDGAYRTTEPIEVQASVAGEQTFALTDVESTLRVGETGDVTARVTNTGPVNATGVVLLVESTPATLVPRETEFAIGALPPGESANVSFRVDATTDAEPGPRLVSFRVRYRGQADRTQETDPIDARLAVAPDRDEFRVTAVNSTLAAGDTAVVSLQVENRVNETLRNVRARLFVDDPLSSDDSEAFVSRLDPGERTTLRFRVAADASAIPKEYPLLVDFTYEDARGEEELSDTYFVAATVTEPESGGGLPVDVVPLALLVGALVVLVAVVVWWRRRRSRGA
ncbi:MULTISPECIES: COG1361 S-layer family protein [Salinibaculum]|uniref:COG1361 S-layer family protein n=1 Tax=Salinibaculum TaxID=2732368 RepID=UPI0030CCCEEB